MLLQAAARSILITFGVVPYPLAFTAEEYATLTGIVREMGWSRSFTADEFAAQLVRSEVTYAVGAGSTILGHFEDRGVLRRLPNIPPRWEAI